MATLVQQSAELFADNTSSIAPSITGVTAGNTVIMLVACSQSGTNTALTAPAGWSTAISTTGPTTNTFRQQVAVFYKENAASGSHSGTVTFANNSFAAAIICEFSGLKTSSSLDTTNSQNGTATTSASTNTATNAQANSLVLAVLCVSSDAGTMTGLSTPASSGYTNINGELDETAHTGYQFSYKNVSSSASQSGSWTWTNNAQYGAAVVIFQDVVPGPTITVNPADQTVNNGATANFSVTATGGTAPLSYQWKFNGSNVGTNSSSYSRTAAYADQGGQVTVVVTDAALLTATSTAATLRVAFNTTGTGPRAYPNLGGPIGAGPVEAWLRGTDAGGGGSSAPVGLGSETDTALALTGRQIRAVGLATETDTAFARTVVSARATGLAAETDTALALARLQIRATGLAVETDTAFARGSARPPGVSLETDTAFALSPSAGAAVGLAAETDTALALSGRQILATGLASETDTALALAAFTGTQVGTASETDTALQLAGRQIRAVGLSSEADVALALAAASVRQAGVATETDTALALAARQISAVGLANETDTALALLAGGAVQVGLATETDTAFALAGEQIGGIVIPQTSFAEFSGAVVKTKQEPKRARLRTPKPVERKKAAPKLEPSIAPVGMATEADEALALAGWSVQRGLYRTKPIATYPRLTREHCSHCGAPVSAHVHP